MPTYEYRCKSCEHEIEAFQSIKDAALTDCPVVQASRARAPDLGDIVSAQGRRLVQGPYSSVKSTNQRRQGS